ncbi:MAG: carbohydrate ABC transporter permease [Planctomycetota bacterium]|nr:carbohydrate ABC transporter permease [Planctomycetota bacterium]
MAEPVRTDPSRRPNALRSLLPHVFMILVTGAFLMPLVWMVLTALKPVEQTTKTPPEWLPRVWTASFVKSYHVYPNGEARRIKGSEERQPVDRIRRLAVPEALVYAVLEPGDAENLWHGRRMLVKVEDVASEGGDWGADVKPGPGRIRWRVGIEREKKVFPCRIAELHEPGAWLVREYVPDLRQAKATGSGGVDPYFWTVVPEKNVELSVQPLWQNVPAALAKMNFWSMLLNTLWVCLLGMIGTTFVSALAAYGFAFGRFPGKGLLFGLTLATMMVPFPATMVPLFQLYRDLGWIGTFKPLWVHCWFGAAFNIFLLRQFFLGLPRDLLDAARIDGCSELEIFWHVVVPLSRPALVMVALFHFLFAWKDFMGPLLYLNDKSQFTLSLGLHAFQSQQGGTPWHLVMAASAVFSLPLIALFLAAMKTFIRGIAMTGIKG